jgi:hypothetical protein
MEIREKKRLTVTASIYQRWLDSCCEQLFLSTTDRQQDYIWEQNSPQYMRIKTYYKRSL